MKKNKMMRMASVLLVLTMLTTSIIGGTFAKYTTTGSATDTARVAKWGVTVTTSGALYSDAYAKKKENAGNTPAAWVSSATADSITVAAATKSQNIVAPGTKSYGNGLSFSISGTPEVAVTVKATITAEDIFLKAGTYGVLTPVEVESAESLKRIMGTGADAVKVYSETEATPAAYVKVTESNSFNEDTAYYVLTNEVTVDDGGYYPVEYTLEGGTNNSSETSKTAVKVAELLAKAVNNSTNAQAGYKASYTDIASVFAANTDLGVSESSGTGLKMGSEKLTWEWAFEKKDSSSNPDSKVDLADTLLGDMIAARGTTNPTNVFVEITNDTVTVLTIHSTDEDYTVTKNVGSNETVVANLRTKFDIKLEVTQID